jgi:hypothetical protein
VLHFQDSHLLVLLIGPNEFIEFPIVAANPDKEGSFKWKAVQTYDNGDVTIHSAIVLPLVVDD